MLDLTNQKFGKLTALERLPHDGSRYGARWKCLCDCGNEVIVPATVLKNRQRSCGCVNTGNRSHGLYGTAENRIWRGMKNRCSVPTLKNYHRYGGRGIRVCDRWEDSFEAFLSDMGPRPSPNHSLDRINNDGNYEPSNCRWATAKQQSSNTIRTVRVQFQGEELPLNEACLRSGISRRTVRSRLQKGWSLERALSEPVRSAF
jgi:hypothetical protein